MEKEKKWKDIAFEYLKSILLALVIALLLVNFVVLPVRVSGPSMNPTLQDGELGFSSIISRNISEIKRNDLVVTYLEVKNELIVKRVVGLPHERIKCVDGVIYINDEVYQQDYLDQDYVNSQESSLNANFTYDFQETTLGEDEYFLLGDNRPHSADSRVFGVFNKKDIRSVGIFVWFPFDQFGMKK